MTSKTRRIRFYQKYIENKLFVWAHVDHLLNPSMLDCFSFLASEFGSRKSTRNTNRTSKGGSNVESRCAGVGRLVFGAQGRHSPLQRLRALHRLPRVASFGLGSGASSTRTSFSSSMSISSRISISTSTGTSGQALLPS